MGTFSCFHSLLPAAAISSERLGSELTTPLRCLSESTLICLLLLVSAIMILSMCVVHTWTHFMHFWFRVAAIIITPSYTDSNSTDTWCGGPIKQCDEPKTWNAQKRGFSCACVCVCTHGRCTVCLCRRSWSSRRCSSPTAGCRCPCLHRSPPDMWYSDLQKSKRHTFIASGWERCYRNLQCCCPFYGFFSS